ncbi:MAG: GlsB/YeaQ/YmgE family stress response membrane protein [Proteobacteria bacterium]|nr:GlsB/YeaQ/YmgE family stress response membrane protein [Pseudomonadota bacterium]
MEWVWFIAIGAAAGWLAGKVFSGFSYGLLGNTVIGVIGAIVGQWGFRQLGIHIGLDYRVDSLIMAFVGAVILLICLGLIRRAK